MSGFKALNLESDDESDVEVDDIKELQIEDALKLYQTALKFHAEGPDSFEQAAAAYDELFQSEIFQYPESQTELRRIELLGPLPETDEYWEDGVQAGVAVASGGMDAGPSTLPQILHLSHKNYAQFKLEYLDSRLQYLNYSLHQILKEAGDALDHFVEALDKDDTDLDLWRRMASVGEILDSKRVARFCLEAVLEGDEDGLGTVLSLPGLDEGLAAEHLRKIVGKLEDELSVLQAPLPIGKRRVLSKMLKQRLNSYEAISSRQQSLKEQEAPRVIEPTERPVLQAPSTWAEFGNALLERHQEQENGAGPRRPAPLSFDLGKTHSMPTPTTSPRDDITNTAAAEEGLRTSAEVANSPTAVGNEPHSPRQSIHQQHNDSQPAMEIETNGVQDPPQTAPDADEDMIESPATMTLPTRKRSTDTAGLGDAVEEGRTKSKRTRMRDSHLAEDSRQSLEDANRRWEHEQQLNEYQAADDWLFETVGNLFERIGVIGFAAGKDVRQEMQVSDSDSDNAADGAQPEKKSLKLAKGDLQTFLSNFSDVDAHFLTLGGEHLDVSETAGVSGFGEGTKSGVLSTPATKNLPSMPNHKVAALLEHINNDWLLLEQIVWSWTSCLLQPSEPTDPESSTNSYTSFHWDEALKTTVVRILVTFDEHIFEHASTKVEDEAKQAEDQSLAAMIQTIFELHLDVYCLVKQSNSGVDADTIAIQKNRLARWSELARESMHLRTEQRRCEDKDGLDLEDTLNLRFMWAVTFNIAAADDVTQDHVIETMQNLRSLLVEANEPTIHLQNNAVMPELSVSALDREISRLKTKDFFLKVTNQDVSDPVAVIESLEPLLGSLERANDQDGYDSPKDDDADLSANVSTELVHFLQGSDISIRLLLWQRLRDAYIAIDYKPMVMSCYFKMLRTLLNELKSTTATLSASHERQVTILKTLRQIKVLMKKAFQLVQSCETAFECIDEESLRSAVTTFGEVLQLLQVFNVFEDAVRVGQSRPPTTLDGKEVASFHFMTKALHESQVHIWIILYRLFEEAIFQFHDLFPTPAEDRFDFLRTIHRNLGLRHICGESNRAFVQMLKTEFFQMNHVEGYDSEQSQVLYDLWGINCFLNPSYELIEHRCTRNALLDRGMAMQAVDLLIQQSSKLPIKDLVKHSLKDTIDKVHGAAPRKRPTDSILRNREIYRAFLRSSINPLDLYGCLKGEGSQLGVSPIPKEDAVLGSKGWYFLMGHISLAKYRSVKRMGPTPTEDVDIAIAFFNQDLEFSGDNWETWFRLAQAYDTKIEESVVWSAEKLNNSMNEVAQLQRAAIHCYIMATALAYRSADLRAETSEKMTEMFTDFAMRMYASSREPFGMKAFELDDSEKFLSYPSGVARGKPFQPLRPFTAWKLAKALFQRALAGRPHSWHLHYMLGKCLWKMHTAKDISARDVRPKVDDVLSSLVRTVGLLPDQNKKDSREKRDPFLEPHYKLVSIVHKLFTRDEISLEEATEALTNTPYARSLPAPTVDKDWEAFLLAVLKNLRAADKSNWHHRMIARAARIVDESNVRSGEGSVDNFGAMGAKHELTQQMFTKTMVLQVWRPECERAGRHFVYTARYTRFFVRILEQLKDRSNLEMLARRVRRKPHDIFEHSLVWQDICTAYLRLLRSHATLPEGLETSTFSNIAHDEFLARKEPLEKWMQGQEPGRSPALDVLREVQELKKINQSLMKPGPIDDLIGDSYAYLFNTIGKQLWEEERRIKQEEEARRPPPMVSPPRNPMMSLTHLMNVDGASDQPPRPAQPPAAAQHQNEPPARRKIGVGRREIRTTAESCAQKAKPAPSSSYEVKHTGPLPRVQVIIDNSRVHLPGDTSVDTSAPGSIHDSADDESELSDLEEEGDEEEDEGGVKVDEPPRPLFPGLVGQVESRQTSEGSETAGEDAGNGDGDVQMEGAEGQMGNGEVVV